MIKHGLLLGIMLGLSACAGAPKVGVQHTMAWEEGRLASQEMARAVAREDISAAYTLAQTALQAFQKVDQVREVNQLRLDLASLALRLQRPKDAATWLSAVSSVAREADPVLALEWAIRQVSVAMQEKQWRQVQTALAAARQVCTVPCARQLTLDVFEARLAFARQEYAIARVILDRILQQFPRAHTGEFANAARLRAQIALRQPLVTDTPEADLQFALAVDQALGRSDRIAEDLEGLAQWAASEGRDEMAQDYRQRAADTRKAASYAKN